MPGGDKSFIPCNRQQGIEIGEGPFIQVAFRQVCENLRVDCSHMVIIMI